MILPSRYNPIDMQIQARFFPTSFRSVAQAYRRTGVLLIALMILLGGFGTTWAEETSNPDEIKQIVEKVKTIEEGYKRENLGISELRDYSKQLIAFKQVTGKCMETEQAALDKADADLKQLGDIKKKESKEVLKLRKQQETARSLTEARLQECTALNLRIQTSQDLVDARLKKQLEVRLFARGDDIFDVIALNLKQPVKWFTQSWDYANKNSWLFNKATASQINWLIGSSIVALLWGLLFRWRCLPWVARRQWSDTTASRFMVSTVTTFTHDAPIVLPALAITLCMAIFTSDLKSVPVMAALSYGLSFLFVARLIIRISLNPTPPGQLFLQVTPSVAKQLAQRMQVLAVLMMIGYLVIDTLVWASLPEFARSLARSAIRVLLAINIVWVLWLFQHLAGKLRHSWFRYGLSLVLVVAVVADLTGYSNLAGWLFRSVFGTLVATGMVFTFIRLTRDLFISLEYARTPAEQRFRRMLGLPSEGHLAFFFWMRVLVSLGFWILLLWLLILIWDLSSGAVLQIESYIRDGFMIGELRIVPSRVLFAAVTMAVLIALTSWAKGLMKTQLERSPMERGTREAMITMAGYAGVLIAIIVALGMAGIDFANLALIAGALSVGIGFGLQNIVNNFISGLILLFERPIKTGDWIVVNNTEGYVKRIRIRSTQIQTFDRADVIVPNSELISGQVTNWMLSDTTGRARIPIGVAYGSDVQKVKTILLRIADDHPDVLTDGSAPEPFVLFREFADSSLNFELRCHIRNIDNRLRVISDINFAIDKAFREEGITIPFPQRDVHIIHDQPPREEPAA
ncbi:MAG: mechanosensitive ion channel [Gammaproteobacteria bacterium]|nr:mechanosensitive ion channel [Gammaproteobacteria bacterium]